ncbi:pentapeptide repeat-containing protein [Paludisphaera rhizosphaerae]|uniref:pentapeptide repeat-containing protein n=1 Tax=Paludisphaera rhizosphaerae TaxID=2711216 RepID=UPI0013EB288A|nr:pentapeptide repeat-containing protein [Paludisphaera rhizosphaerae]
MAESSPPARRLPRFTVRGMIFGVLFLAVVLGWIASVRRADWQRSMFAEHMQYADEELRRARDQLQQLKRGPQPDRTRSFWEAGLEGSNLSGMTIASRENAFQRASFRNCRLEDATLAGGDSSFQLAHFDGAKLTRASLKGGSASFQDASFAGADLTGATLAGGGSSFQRASFEGAILIGATLSGDFAVANLSRAKFESADLSALIRADLNSCYFKEPPTYNAATKFPPGFDPVARLWRRVE